MANEYGRLIVKFKQGRKKADVSELAESEDVGEIPQIGVKVIRVRNHRNLARFLERNSNIEYIEEDVELIPHAVPNDPLYESQIRYYANRLNLPAAWDVINESNVPVAVVDTGCLLEHEDIPTPIFAYNTASHNYDMTDYTYSTSTKMHGTGVVGTLCAIGNNGIGSVGVVWKLNKLIIVKTTDSAGIIQSSAVAEGIIYAADKGAKVINCSFGSSSEILIIKNAIDYAYNKGCIIVASAGNNDAEGVSYPAKHDNVLGVSSTSNGTTRHTMSYGEGLDLMANYMWYSPRGTGISDYNTFSATSCSSPQVCGVIALIWELLSHYTNTQMIQFMKNYAKPMTPNIEVGGWHKETGYGLADAGNYVTQALRILAEAQSAGIFFIRGKKVKSLFIGGKEVKSAYRYGKLIYSKRT